MKGLTLSVSFSFLLASKGRTLQRPAFNFPAANAIHSATGSVRR
jgi:hypothetical protein